jgi:uncharacterized protein (DUF1684 family)
MCGLVGEVSLGRRGALTLLLIGLAAACSPTPARPAAPYEETLASERRAKDEWMRTDKESPLVEGSRSAFLPLAYFSIDPNYNVAATLSPAADQPIVEMLTSTGQRRQMRQAGFLDFRLKDQPLRVIALVEAEDRAMARLSVMFADMTNGSETYAAGRYIDLDRSPSGIYEIDFNRAYHPYCYYNPTYDCPYPPQENRLKLPIRAGERMPKGS